MTFLITLGIVVLAVCGLLARQYLIWRLADLDALAPLSNGRRK